MAEMNYSIRKLDAGEQLPFRLLLLADEVMAAIEKYIYDCDVYVITDAANTIAVCALYKNSDTELEIKNMAVDETIQSKGIGSYLMGHMKQIARASGYKDLVVGTASVGRQIYFYERNGFVRYDIKKDFFIEHYPFPIYEDGELLRDMVMLQYKL